MRFAEHLEWPVGEGELPGSVGIAGGAACGDLVSVGVEVRAGHVTAAGFTASGCGAATAAGSAAVALIRDQPALVAAKIGTREISQELGGLSPGKLHAADLAADALARALGAAVRTDTPDHATFDEQFPKPDAPARGVAPERDPARGATAERDAAREASAIRDAAEGGIAGGAERIMVALSGGVDSAVAALLLQRAGHDVCTVTLELWADPDNDAERSCCSAAAVRGARSLAHRLGLAHLTLDLREEFRAGVVTPYLEGHAAGETPNPCVRCNGQVRLDAMLDYARRAGASTLATGHYARVHHDGEGPLLSAAADAHKDQSYMLAGLDPATLAHLRFPLAERTKPEVRAIAEAAGLAVAKKPESQDLCFLAGTGREAFLARHGKIAAQPGEIVDRAGRVLGRHRGHHGFTVGQRRGLGLGGGAPRYVLATDARANRVVVGDRTDLHTTHVPLRDVTLHRDAGRVDSVKLRYRARPLPARLHGSELHLGEPAAGAAPGQTAVLLADDLVVGTGTITRP